MNTEISQIEYFNTLVSQGNVSENMPLSLYRSELTDCILDLAKMLPYIDDDSKRQVTRIMEKVAGSVSMLTDLISEVEDYYRTHTE